MFSATNPVFYASAGCSGIATLIIMTAIYYKSIGGVMRIAYKRCACKIGTISPDDGPVSTSVSSVGVYTISNSFRTVSYLLDMCNMLYYNKKAV